MGFGEQSDDELLSRYRSTRDNKWITQLFARYVQLIYGVCLRYTPDVREAEDFTMEIYQKVSDKALTHQIKTFKSWVYVVSKHHCLEQIRKVTGRRIETFDPDFMQFRKEIHHSDDMTDKLALEVKYDVMENCLKQLNDLQKRSIDLFYYQNKSYMEIAKIIEDEVSQVRSYLQNGRRNIKKCVERNHRK